MKTPFCKKPCHGYLHYMSSICFLLQVNKFGQTNNKQLQVIYTKLNVAVTLLVLSDDSDINIYDYNDKHIHEFSTSGQHTFIIIIIKNNTKSLKRLTL